MNANFSRIETLLRKERKITQKQAASDLGVSQALLSHYEKGIRGCNLNFLVRCADYYGVSCDYLLGRSPEPSGQTLSVEEIPSPDQSRDSHMSGSVLATLNKKLISNSLNVLFDLLVRSGNHELLLLVSDELFVNVYSVFRMIFSANQSNNNELFKLPDKLYRDLAAAAYLRDRAYISLNTSTKNGVASENLLISTKILSKNYPLFASSLLNVIKNAETSLEKLK